ncbi:hypothetical protein [Dyadobacter fanqingshengii]|uniref:Uncharacterized protein n=1 Tax=Dyadobacter fanqingshengii TaxID=2906443 RepID=A0A9X1PBM5_9BACT|nr:hypothetical protein [Dyadobacter fanqingshengii]MCF0042256.1 hypothetical protein [Dyadobacter fanqingshengii]USJ35215.1 hypothetical protein NFI81_21275 [Dyadobacter fanqingshengii]
MRTLRTLTIIAALAVSAAGYAQTVPTTPTSPTQPQSVPTQDPTTTTPASTNPTTEKKAEFNSPQSPVRPSNTPSEDTLIKDQQTSGAVIKDSLMPATDKKAERMNRRKNKKAANEAESSSTEIATDPNKKP